MKKIFYFIFVFSFLIFLISFGIAFFKNKAIYTETFFANVNISNVNRVIGIDVNSSALTFGQLSAGGGSSRKIILRNNYSFPIVVKTKVEGDIVQLISFNDNIRIEAGEEMKIPFYISAGEDTNEGFYSGIVRLDVVPA